jgi:hypothetical protein
MNPLWLALIPFLLDGDVGSFGKKANSKRRPKKRRKKKKANTVKVIPNPADVSGRTGFDIVFPVNKASRLSSNDLEEWQRLQNLRYWNTQIIMSHSHLFRWGQVGINFVIYNGKMYHADSPRVLEAIRDNLPLSTPFDSPFRNTGLPESEFDRLISEVKSKRSLEPIQRLLASGSFARRKKKKKQPRLSIAPLSSLGTYNDDNPRIYLDTIKSEFSIGELNDESRAKNEEWFINTIIPTLSQAGAWMDTSCSINSDICIFKIHAGNIWGLQSDVDRVINLLPPKSLYPSLFRVMTFDDWASWVLPRFLQEETDKGIKRALALIALKASNIGMNLTVDDLNRIVSKTIDNSNRLG